MTKTTSNLSTMILKINNLNFKLIYFSFFFLCSSFLFGQVVHFSGKILNPNKDKIMIRAKGYMKVIKLLSDGSFDDTLDIKAGDYSLSDYNESTALYLEPGYNLNLTLDTKAFDESIMYKGEGEKPNNFLAKYYLYDEQNTLGFSKLKSMSDNDFFEYKMGYYNGVMDLLESSNLENDNFKTNQKNRFNFNMLEQILYKSGEAYFKSNLNNVVSDHLDLAFEKLDFKDSVHYNANPYFRSLLDNYFVAGLVAGSKECYDRFYKELNDKQRKNIIFSIKRGISFYNDNELEPYYTALTKLVKDKDQMASISKTYDQINSLQKGNPSPAFNYESMEGKKVSLKDLKGKLIYIDVWATWCGPCKVQIPFLKELEVSFRDKEVAFVSISIDNPEDENKWREMVNDKELKGVQLIADKAWKSSFAKDYVIQGIPRFILIDQKGNIITPFAPRPAAFTETGELTLNLELKDLLNKYLN